MTTAFTWHELKKLVVIDHRIYEIQALVKKKHDALKLSQDICTKNAENLASCELALRSAHKELDRIELLSKDIRAQISKKKNQLASALSAKESEALEHEHTTLKLQLDALDAQSMTVLEQQELLTSTLASLKEKNVESQNAQRHLVQLTEAEIAQAEAERTTLEADWNAHLPLVPVELKNMYVNLRTRLKHPAVPVVGNSCGGCFMELLTQDAHALSTRTVIQCRGCYRFLFLPDATTPLSPQQAA